MVVVRTLQIFSVKSNVLKFGGMNYYSIKNLERNKPYGVPITVFRLDIESDNCPATPKSASLAHPD